MSGWHIGRRKVGVREFVYECILRRKRKLLRLHSKHGVITLHPVAFGHFTKPETGGQVSQKNRAGESEKNKKKTKTVVLWSWQIHTDSHPHSHIHTGINTCHPCITGMCPRKAKNAREREEAAES